MKNIRLASLLSILILTSCSSRTDSVSSTKGIIGNDDSTVIAQKPAYAEFLTSSDAEGSLPFCNGVRVSGDRIFTAAHCVRSMNNQHPIVLSNRSAARTFDIINQLDFASGQVVGGSAPSNSIKIHDGALAGRLQLEAVWFDIGTGKWRLSKGSGELNGSFIEHNLDMNPGASGSGIYLLDELGTKSLVAIHLGFVKSRNFNLAVAVVGSSLQSQDDIKRYNYQPEFCYYRDGPNIGKPAPEILCKPESEGGNGGSGSGSSSGSGEGSGGSGDNGSGGSDSGPGNGDGGNGNGNGGDGGDSGSAGDGNSGSDGGSSNEGNPGTPAGASGNSSEGGDSSSSGSSSAGGIFIFPGLGGSHGGSGTSSGPSDDGGEGYLPCFECDLIYQETEEKSRFNKDDCGPSEIEPLFKDITLPKDFRPAPSFVFKKGTPTEFTDALKKFAERLLNATQWKPSSAANELSEDAQRKIQEWLDLVAKNMDDYYALIVESLKSPEVKEPELSDIDTSAESIAQARSYLESVRQQILANPDQYLEARKQVANAAEAAFGVAEKALANGDQETANAALQIGLTFADAAIGFVPVAGWVKDSIEAATGYNLITGEKLDDFSRTMAWVGVLTGGIGSKLAIAGKAYVMAEVVSQASAGTTTVVAAGILVRKANETIAAAKSAGINSGIAARLRKLRDAIKFRKPLATAEEVEKDVAKSLERYKDLPLIKGEKPINGLYAGETYFTELKPNLKAKYPEGIRIKENGMPDFTPVAKELPNGGKSVKIEPTGSHAADERAANALAGYDETLDDYTWHHHEDYGIMQLVPEDIHNAVKHHGGATIWGYKSKY